MITNREFVTRIINDLGAITKDEHLSRRWILFIGRQTAQSYIAQKFADGSLAREINLVTNIKCMKMIRVKSIDCCFAEFRLCKILMRSEKKIPGLMYGRAGATILSVTNIDDTINFYKTDLSSYSIGKNRRYGNLDRNLYYVDDGYIWIPDVKIEAVNVRLITLERKKSLALSECYCDKDQRCVSEWDFEFICPDKLLDAVISRTIQEVSMRLQIPVDANPNMDQNQKTQTVQ